MQRVRAVKGNLVYIIGISPEIAQEDLLKSDNFFGQYGLI